MTHAVMKDLWLLLVLLLLLLLLLLLEGQSVLVNARKLLQSPTAAREIPHVGIIGNVIVPRGIILSTLQIINRSIDQLEEMFAEYVWGFNNILLQLIYN